MGQMAPIDGEFDRRYGYVRSCKCTCAYDVCTVAT